MCNRGENRIKLNDLHLIRADQPVHAIFQYDINHHGLFPPIEMPK